MNQPLSPSPADLLHHGKWLVLPVVAIATLVIGTWWIEGRDAVPAVSVAVAGETSVQTAEAQAKADDTTATLNLATVKPLTGPIVQRPEFVSELEWHVLQEVAKQQADSDLELTRLVNSLRFNKQLTLCQSWPAHLSTSQRLLLAQQLLAEIPLHVRQQELSVNDGKNLQQQLLNLTISDPQERRRHIDVEAAKLRVLFQAMPDDPSP